MTTIDHDRCSELLPAYLDGSLDRADAAAVADHVAGCDECARERDGLAALRAGDTATLTHEERAHLESAVMAAMGRDGTAEIADLSAARRRRGRAGQLLGAAAVVTVIATFAYFGLAGGGSDLETTGVDAGGGDAQESLDREGAVADSGAGGGRTQKSKVQTARGSTADTTTASAAGAGLSPPRPTFTVARDPYTSAELEKLGKSSIASVTFAAAYSTADADGRLTLLEQLVAEAERATNDAVAEQVEECAEGVLESEDPIVPMFGALGRVDGTDAVIVGFAWAPRSGRLNSYMVWAWERDDCGVALEYIEGRIETAN